MKPPGQRSRKPTTRRQFIRQAAVGAAVLLTVPRLRAAAEAASIEVLLKEPIGTISPDLYGHFTEHIGGVIYDGIWVGEDSKVPNQMESAWHWSSI